MSADDFRSWLDDHGYAGSIRFAKRLSGQETFANGRHRSGQRVAKETLFRAFPSLCRPEVENPTIAFDLHIDSHAQRRRARAVWNNDGLHGGTRDEARLTNLGGAESALHDPENTGALCIFAFPRAGHEDQTQWRLWVCRDSAEEDVFEDRFWPVEPGRWEVF